MKKAIYITRLITAVIFFILTILAFIEIGYGIKILHLEALSAKLLLVFLAIAVIITFIFGRIGCSLICPFGIFQDLLCQFRHETSEYRKSYIYKYIILAVTTGVFIFGIKYIKGYMENFAGFGKGFTIGLVLFLIGLGILTVFKHRFFCTDICPCGALLGLISKFSLFRIKINKDECMYCGTCERNCPSGCIDVNNDYINNETCVKCLKCLAVCPKNATSYGIGNK